MTWPNPSMTRWLMNSRRSTTGDLRRFAVHEIAAYGLKLRGASFGWQWSQDGEVQASIGASVQGGEDGATLVLNYTLNCSPVTQRIRLAASPCRWRRALARHLPKHGAARRASLHRGVGRFFAPRLSPRVQFAAGMSAISFLAPARQGAGETEGREPDGFCAAPRECILELTRGL